VQQTVFGGANCVLLKMFEELRPEIPVPAVHCSPNRDRLNIAKVEVTDSLSSQPGVYPRLVSENEIGAAPVKTCRIEPFRNRRGGTPPALCLRSRGLRFGA